MLLSHILNWENSLCYTQKDWDVNGNTFHENSKYKFMTTLKLFLRNYHFIYMTYKYIHINLHVSYWQKFHLSVLLKSKSGEMKPTDHIKEIPAKYLHFSLKTFYSLNEWSLISFFFKIKMINLYLQIFYWKYETILNCMLFLQVVIL